MSIGEAFDETEHLLSLDNPEQVLSILQQIRVCDGDETVLDVGKAGEGNMNLVMRITTDRRSVIVKQARPWVEKYPTIPAPSERIFAEIDFYEHVAAVPELARQMPEVIAKDARLRLLVLQDLGSASDYSSLYESEPGDPICDAVFDEAVSWLRQLHHGSNESRRVGCDSLRELNHAHMFAIPLSDPPAIELDTVCSGLEAASQQLRTNPEVIAAVNRLGELYLRPSEESAVLLHGDFYPGSWLNTDRGFRVIDPEFCFCGAPEFDLGILSAHRIFCHARPEIETVHRVVESYGLKTEMPVVLGFAGVELIRRLIGVAQLPLVADLDLRTRWMSLGEALVMEFAKSD